MVKKHEVLSTSAKVSNTFQPADRLIKKGEFQAVFNDVQKRATSSHFLLLAHANQLDRPRLGVMVAKRHTRNIVHRNRIKRLLREDFRLRKHDFMAQDIIVLLRAKVKKQDMYWLKKEITKLWQVVIQPSMQ